MFAQKFKTIRSQALLIFGFKKEKRSRAGKGDTVTEQVRKMLQTTDQKLILMVRG